MDLADDLVLTRLRCSPFHGSLAADPIGSAGSYDAFLCVEIPLPWERDIGANEPFSSLGGAMRTGDGRRWRAEGLVPDHGVGGTVRVLSFEQPEPRGHRRGPFLRREWQVEPESLVALGEAILSGEPRRMASFDEAERTVSADVVELMVCTHGRRDTCCGGLGAAMHEELRSRLEDRDGATRLWRCSHTGGHRFAPTALSFPDGYAWAHLTAELADRLVHRVGDPADFVAHCRGTALFDGGPTQAADRAAFAHVGWDWLEATRSATVVAYERDTLATTVRIVGQVPNQDGREVVIDVHVEVERHVPAPTCGMVDGPEYKVEPVWKVTSVAEVGPVR